MPRLSAGLPNPILMGAILAPACGMAGPAAISGAVPDAQGLVRGHGR